MLKLLKPGDTFSVLNLLFGFISMLFVLYGDFRLASIFVLLSALSDGVDGFVARKLGNGKLGENLDSLADFSSFSISPSLLAMSVYQNIILIPPILLYISCSALRLSSFYMFKRKRVFIGMPTPAAGITITISAVTFHHPHLVVFLFLLLSALMVSNIRYPKPDRLISVCASLLILFYIACQLLPCGYLDSVSAYMLFTGCLIYLAFGTLYTKHLRA